MSKSYFLGESLIFKILFIAAYAGLFFVAYEYIFLSRQDRNKYIQFIVLCLFVILIFRRKYKGRI